MIFKLKKLVKRRKKIIKKARNYSCAIGIYTLKCVCYHESFVGKDNDEWTNAIASYIYIIGGYTVNSSSGKLSKSKYKKYLFDCYANETCDYNARLVNFRVRNKKYPDFEVTDDLVKLFQKVFEELRDKTVPMIADKNEYTLEEYKSAVKEVLSNNGIK